MSSTRASVHVRGASRTLVLAAVQRAMSRRGLELIATPSRSEPHLVRVRLAEQGSWVSLAIEELETPDAWARTLARALRVPVLGAWSLERRHHGRRPAAGRRRGS